MRIFSLLLLVSSSLLAQTRYNGSYVFEGTLNYCSDAGSTDAYACNLSPAITAYGTGVIYHFKANTINTDGATLALNGLAATAIKIPLGAITTDPPSGCIRAGQIVDVVYDGTNFLMQSQCGSNGTQYVEIEVYPSGTAWATGDGKAYFPVPPALNGMNLVSVAVQLYTAGTTGTLNIDLARCAAVTTGNGCSGTVSDMLSTNLTADSNEPTSYTAATAAVIDTANDDVTCVPGSNNCHMIRIDVDAIHTTPAQGGVVILGFRLP